MSEKTLRTSTLSLRFMKNGQRAKQLNQVELERAEVQDDGKWEVSSAVKESWGLSKELKPSYSEVHEPSYLPFLFSEEASPSPDVQVRSADRKLANGRRRFDKRGEELHVVKDAFADTENVTRDLVAQDTDSKGRGRKVHPRPVTISASGTSGKLYGFEDLSKPSKTSKSARDAIFQSSGVGTDLRHSRTVVPPPLSAFIKPVGIDDPKDIQSAPDSVSAVSLSNIMHGARNKTKREREPSPIESTTASNTKKAKKPKRSPTGDTP